MDLMDRGSQQIAQANGGSSGSQFNLQKFLDNASVVGFVSLWILPMVVIALAMMLQNNYRTMGLLGDYALFSDHWWQHEQLYRGHKGTNYLPGFAILFTPFTWMTPIFAGIAWRLLAVLGLLSALRKLIRSLGGNMSRGEFIVSMAAVPATLGALQIGQANIMLAMALLQAAACMLEEKRWRFAAWLVIAFLIKPLALAALGLGLVIWPVCRGRILFATLASLALPFFTVPFDYAGVQYAAAYLNLQDCSVLTEHRFSDFNGMLQCFNMQLPIAWANIIRVLAGLVLACAVWIAHRRLSAPSMPRWLVWAALSTSYLMLFNPMTESNSYGIVAIPMALCGWWWIEQRQRWSGWLTLFAIFCIGAGSEIVRPWIGNEFSLYIDPFFTLLFLLRVLVQSCMQTTTLRGIEKLPEAAHA